MFSNKYGVISQMIKFRFNPCPPATKVDLLNCSVTRNDEPFFSISTISGIDDNGHMTFSSLYKTTDGVRFYDRVDWIPAPKSLDPLVRQTANRVQYFYATRQKELPHTIQGTKFIWKLPDDPAQGPRLYTSGVEVGHFYCKDGATVCFDLHATMVKFQYELLILVAMFHVRPQVRPAKFQYI